MHVHNTAGLVYNMVLIMMNARKTAAYSELYSGIELTFICSQLKGGIDRRPGLNSISGGLLDGLCLLMTCILKPRGTYVLFSKMDLYFTDLGIQPYRLSYIEM